VECLLILKEQADVNWADKIATKEQKGEYVFSTLKNHVAKKQLRLIDFLKNKKIEHHGFFIVNAIYVKTTLENIRALANFSEITVIADNPWTHFDAPKNASLLSDEGDRTIEWGIQNIKADSVWLQGNKGQGVVIGGQDTGYQWDHPALKKAYRGYIDSTKTDHSYSWHDAIHGKSPLSKDSLNPCGFNSKAPCDDFGHGTHTMGTMVGDDGLGNQIGVAPLARWVACRNMERGNGSPTTYIESFEWFLAPTDKDNKNPNPKKAPHVINNSWYCSPEEGCNSQAVSALMELAVNNLKKAGVFVVISAGNAGPGCATIAEAASSFESGFTIGANDVNDAIGSFSSRGPKMFGDLQKPYIKPNVVAPGVNIRSCVPGNSYAAGWSGTSMAGPHVAGAVALVIAANPKLAGQVDAIENILEMTALKLTSTDTCGGMKKDVVPNFTFGYGRINTLAAVKMAKSFTTNTSDAVENTFFNVFPNPANAILTIRAEKQSEKLQIAIYDTFGKKVLVQNEKNTQQAIISLETLSVGAYFYEIQSEKEVQVGKFLKF
jgi:subtilisin family serine protease